MAARPERPALRDRYDRRRRELLEAAVRVFARQGFDQTTMQDVAEELGLAAGALYHYFAGKDDLLAAICDELMDPLLERSSVLLAQAAPPDEHLRELLHLWVDHVVEHRDHMLVFQQERHVIEQGAQWRGARNARKKFERLLDDLLARVETQRGLALPDRRLVLGALLGMVNHTAQWYQPRGRLSPQDVADGYLDLVLG
jgi:AcrR family transcriptional regulator